MTESKALQPWEIALSLVETPFLHLGRTRNGCDCVGMLIIIERERGNNPIDLKVYSREAQGSNLLEQYLEKNCGPKLKPYEGYAVNDILLIQFPKHPFPSHVGMVVPHPHGLGIVHCYANVGQVVYHRIDPRWERRIRGVYRCPAKQ